jgi:hypothetical protein
MKKMWYESSSRLPKCKKVDVSQIVGKGGKAEFFDTVKHFFHISVIVYIALWEWDKTFLKLDEINLSLWHKNVFDLLFFSFLAMLVFEFGWGLMIFRQVLCHVKHVPSLKYIWKFKRKPLFL